VLQEAVRTFHADWTPKVTHFIAAGRDA